MISQTNLNLEVNSIHISETDDVVTEITIFVKSGEILKFPESKTQYNIFWDSRFQSQHLIGSTIKSISLEPTTDDYSDIGVRILTNHDNPILGEHFFRMRSLPPN